MSIRTVDTSRFREQAEPERAEPYTVNQIAEAAGVKWYTISKLSARADQMFARVWRLWESVGFDESRRDEIRRELEAIEGRNAA